MAGNQRPLENIVQGPQNQANLIESKEEIGSINPNSPDRVPPAEKASLRLNFNVS